jgi:hypothetical protein
MAISLKSLVIISILMCAGLIFGTQGLSASIGNIDPTPLPNNSQENIVSDYPSPDQISSKQVTINGFRPIKKEEGFTQSDYGNLQVSSEEKAPEQHFMKMLANLVINFITQDKNVNGEINIDSNHSNEIPQNETDASGLNFAISKAEGSDYYELLKEVPMTDEQLKEIQQYSGGKSPTEVVDEFCKEVDSGELHLMAEDIRQSYNYNPASPAILMSFFEKMGNLCP